MGGDASDIRLSRLQRQETVVARALEFCILNATRTNETMGMRWSEYDKKAQLTSQTEYGLKYGAASCLIRNALIYNDFWCHLAESSDESSNTETLPDSVSNPGHHDLLFDTLADWNHQLKHAKIDFKGPQP